MLPYNIEPSSPLRSPYEDLESSRQPTTFTKVQVLNLFFFLLKRHYEGPCSVWVGSLPCSSSNFSLAHFVILLPGAFYPKNLHTLDRLPYLAKTSFLNKPSLCAFLSAGPSPFPPQGAAPGDSLAMLPVHENPRNLRASKVFFGAPTPSKSSSPSGVLLLFFCALSPAFQTRMAVSMFTHISSLPKDFFPDVEKPRFPLALSPSKKKSR